MSSLLMGDILIIFSGLLYAIDVNICKYLSDKIDATKIRQQLDECLVKDYLENEDKYKNLPDPFPAWIQEDNSEADTV